MVGAVLENNRNSVIAGWKQCSRTIEYNGITVIPKVGYDGAAFPFLYYLP